MPSPERSDKKPDYEYIPPPSDKHDIFDPKPGHKLVHLKGFNADHRNILRDELSVSTAEELLYFTSQHKDEITRLLNVKPTEVGRMTENLIPIVGKNEAEEIMRPSEKDDYNFPTGFDIPEDMDFR